jgi:tRNA (pseudouridine54-N1)-methyltransferase
VLETREVRSLSFRNFVVIGQTASAAGDFSTDDLPGSSGRLDVLLRCVRAALLVSHGLRREVRVYLVLRGGPQAPRVLRVSGRDAKFLRPDERSLAILVKKTLAPPLLTEPGRLREVRPGLSLCQGDLDEVLADIGSGPRYVLDERGEDLRSRVPATATGTFFIGDHLGFDDATLAKLEASGCQRVSVGPVSLHSDDVVTLVSNELDRRAAAAGR